MYGEDIVGIYLKPKYCQALAELLGFRAIITRDGYRIVEKLCTTLLFFTDATKREKRKKQSTRE